MLGGIEAGGTKFVCCVADDDMKVLDRVVIDTKTPEYTMKKVVEFFKDKKIDALGVAIFGPIDIDRDSETYGKILNTPKKAWANYNIYKDLKEKLGVPIYIDTDVNGAALCEYYVGYGKGRKSVLYITIGTGIGAGYVIDGNIINGITHPEMGHILVQSREANFEGICPMHKNCLEGMASGESIVGRYGLRGDSLDENHEVWDYIADYVGQALMMYTLILSPDIILIGGGVAKQQHLFDKFRMYFTKYMNGYLSHKRYTSEVDDYIRYPKNGQDAGLIGSLYLAKKALEVDVK